MACLLTVAAASEAPAEESFGRYEVICPLGEGGMGVVYLAEQRHPVRREVALKVLKDSSDAGEALSRFERERQVLAMMEHPNIARLYDAGSSSKGRPYFVMEFVDGEPITTALDRRTASIAQRLELFGEVCRAIDHAHRKGVIHRDIKPSNVLITERDGCLIPKVIDFGIARAAGHLTGRTLATVAGEFLGTPEYASPEQVAGDARAIGPGADIYSLGVLLYELLAGVLPFDPARLRSAGLAGASRILCEETAPRPLTRLVDAGLTKSVAEMRRTNPETLRRLLSKDAARVLSVCLEKDPRCRYVSPAALADDIDRLQRGEPVLAHGPTRIYRSRRWIRRHRIPLVGVAAATFAALIVAAVLRRQPAPLPITVRPLTSYPGTEIHPSFSPDGKRVAFVWDGNDGNFDIYVQPVEGGSPSRLTTDADLDVFPAWSPDGAEIAFVHVSPAGESLRVMPATGGAPRIIAPLHNRELEWVENPASMQRHPGPEWTPDGKAIVMADLREPHGGRALYEFSASGNGVRRLTSPGADTEGDASPAFSPDGRTLAFVRRLSTRGRENLYLLPLPGSEPKLLLAGDAITSVAWLSPREILFSSNRSGPPMLWRVTSNGGVPQPLPGAGRGIEIISYSPVSGSVAFADATSVANIWRCRLSGKNNAAAPERFLSSTRRTESPEFSPDGAKVAFVSNRSGTRQIWIANADGSKAVQISSVGAEVPIGTPRWSPDSRWIVYDTVRNGHSAIAVMRSDGAERRFVTNNSWDDMMPGWSHDGRWIFFACKMNGVLEVCRIPVAGGQSVPITKGGGGEARESPDGRFVYYSKARGIWRAPVEGGPEAPLPGLNDVDTGRYWTVSAGAIYLLRSRQKPWTVYRYDLESGRMSAITTIEKEPDFGSPGLAVSPDGASLLFGQIDNQGSDILVAEGVSGQ